MLRRPLGTDLSRIEGTSARTGNSEGTGDLTSCIKPLDRRLPVEVDRKAAIVVLGTDRNLQRLTVQINAVGSIQINCFAVDLCQPGDWCFDQCPAALQIISCFLRQPVKPIFQPCRVGAKIQKDPVPLVHHFVMYNQVDDGRTLDLTGIKRPLIPLEENHIQRLFRCLKIFRQKLPLMSIPVHRNIAGKRLLVTAGNVPPKSYRRQSVLPFLQIAAVCTRFQRHTGHACLAFRVDRGLIDNRGASCREDNLVAKKECYSPIGIRQAV